jgi:radical SAM superfamily enzyme YgiQ (UPF0313 family)
MKIVLISMPDVTPIVVHESALHIPNLGIASVAGNIDPEHDVYVIDLIRKRRRVRKYLTRTLTKIQPDVVGLSAMTWQFDTCVKVARLVRQLLPAVKIVLGGYHATLMAEEIAASPQAQWFDFIIRGEGEEPCRRLVNALAGRDRIEQIDSLSYRMGDAFVHNPKAKPLDLAALRRPVRDSRRLTSGYHSMYNKIEAIETSRGCTRSCSYCSIRHMYGRSFRTYPLNRVLEDLDEIYYRKRTRWVFIADDNLVLEPDRVLDLCDAIIERGYPDLNLVSQADCISMARHEEMVRKMALAGFKSVFLGIENALPANLVAVHKGDITTATKQAVDSCHRHGIMVVGGLIVGFPDDDEQAIIRNYEFFNALKVDAAYCQILTPYPKTGLRNNLLEAGLVSNIDDYRFYNGLWANVRTKHLTAEELQYLFWYHKQRILGWWRPSELARRDGRGWSAIWEHLLQPAMKCKIDRTIRKQGWEGRYQGELMRMRRMNRFEDLDCV